jgi:hypothetical protein
MLIRALRAMLTASAAALLLITMAPVAGAQDHRLEFSLDGTTWGTTLPRSILDGTTVLVPGESVTGTLHVRSTSATVGVLETSLTNIYASDSAAAQHFGVTVESEIAEEGIHSGLPRTRIADLTENVAVGTPLRLEPGASARISLTIDLAQDTGGSGAQKSTIGLDLALSVTDARAFSDRPDADASAGSPPQVIPALPAPEQGPSASPDVPFAPQPAGPQAPGASGDASNGSLAVTGTEVLGLALAGFIAAVLGTMLIIIGRRRRTQGER